MASFKAPVSGRAGRVDGYVSLHKRAIYIIIRSPIWALRIQPMAPADRIRLPFRWQFVPSQNTPDGSVHWSWRAYTHTGTLAMESEGWFDSLTECMDNARAAGYGKR